MSDDFGAISGPTIAAISAAISAASAVAGGVTSYMSGQANAAIAKSEAEQRMAAARQAAARQDRINAQRQAALVAQVAGQGTTMEGSPMEVYLANAKQGKLESKSILYGGQLAAGSKNFEADLASMQGTGALIGGSLKGVSELSPVYDWIKTL